MIIWTVTLFCAAVEVLVVWISILVSDFRMDFAVGICEGLRRIKLELKSPKNVALHLTIVSLTIIYPIKCLQLACFVQQSKINLLKEINKTSKY